jgi:hypothetical protein
MSAAALLKDTPKPTDDDIDAESSLRAQVVRFSPKIDIRRRRSTGVLKTAGVVQVRS